MWKRNRKANAAEIRHRHCELLDALQVDDFHWPPVECLETVDVGECMELL